MSPEARAAGVDAQEVLRDMVFQALTQGVVVHDRDGRVVAANAAAVRILGLTEDTVAGLTPADPRWRAVHEDGSPFPGEEHPAAVALATGEAVHDVVVGVATTGESVAWLWVTAVPVAHSVLGPEAAVVASFVDISELIRLREQVSASEERYRLLAENASDVVLRVDAEGIIEWVSPSVRDVFGWEPDDVVGRSSLELVHPDVASADTARVEAAVRPIWGVRVRVRAADGGYRWVSANAHPLLDEDGRSIGRVSSWRMIDEQVALEEDLRRRANHDALTGLLTRGELLNRLHASLSRPRRTGGRTAVVFVDVDDFKGINDVHGHAGGDETLRVLAARLRQTLRETDLIARFGGDEIVVVATGINDLNDALRVGELIRSRAREPIALPAADARISVSVGVTVAEHGEEAAIVLARADEAMYQAKASGKDRVVALEPPPRD